MLHIALYQPEIPPNTGNIIRLCANSGCHLHLIHPLGFTLQNKQVKRAGLDYHALTQISEYSDYDSFLAVIADKPLVACSTKGTLYHSNFVFQNNHVLLFGPETRGLPDNLLAKFTQDHIIRIPMLANSRSLNLSNAVAIITYEALRQLGYPSI